MTTDLDISRWVDTEIDFRKYLDKKWEEIKDKPEGELQDGEKKVKQFREAVLAEETEGKQCNVTIVCKLPPDKKDEISDDVCMCLLKSAKVSDRFVEDAEMTVEEWDRGVRYFIDSAVEGMRGQKEDICYYYLESAVRHKKERDFLTTMGSVSLHLDHISGVNPSLVLMIIARKVGVNLADCTQEEIEVLRTELTQQLQNEGGQDTSEGARAEPGALKNLFDKIKDHKKGVAIGAIATILGLGSLVGVKAMKNGMGSATLLPPAPEQLVPELSPAEQALEGLKEAIMWQEVLFSIDKPQIEALNIMDMLDLQQKTGSWTGSDELWLEVLKRAKEEHKNVRKRIQENYRAAQANPRLKDFSLEDSRDQEAGLLRDKIAQAKREYDRLGQSRIDPEQKPYLSQLICEQEQKYIDAGLMPFPDTPYDDLSDADKLERDRITYNSMVRALAIVGMYEGFYRNICIMCGPKAAKKAIQEAQSQGRD
ncbi:MAG: hypothetical protein J6Y85_01380 [Alphaproteobacteria bacterium]|nr:hypothetical protein [Alphaproteobacteria bacterium]